MAIAQPQGGAAEDPLVQAYRWFERMLDAPEGAERHALWQEVEALGAEVRERVQRLWGAYHANEATGVLQRPVSAALDAQAHALQAGQVVGAHRLVKPIGQGGMSTVWLAERTDGVPQPVAIKFPTVHVPGAEAGRFGRERDVLARLVHPNIARLYDAGVTDAGRPYIVMEYVPGRAFVQACNANHWGVRRRLEAFLDVLEAVAFAHRHLVVHRDLKPSNILVDDAARVRLLDFGVAKLLDDGAADAPDLTREAACGLTPRYAAPEQVLRGTITTATDVYALGCVLYETLTGTAPHASTRQVSPQQASEPARADVELDAALHHTPLAPSRAMGRGIATDGIARRDLDLVVQKAIAKDPAARYASAELFAQDVRRLLDALPVHVQRPPVWHRLQLFVRRHRGLSGVAAMAMVVATVLLVLLARQMAQTQAETQRKDAVREFMLDVLQDSLPSGNDPAALPLRQQVDAAVMRARHRFAADSEIQAGLLTELGVVRRAMNQPNEALALFQEATKVAGTLGDPASPALNNAEAQWAAMLTSGAMAEQLDEAKRMAEAALSRCPATIKSCATARATAAHVLSSVASYEGRADDAIQLRGEALSEYRRAYGPAHPETVMAAIDLVRQLRNAGRLREAGALIDETAAQLDANAMRATDLFTLRQTEAVIDVDLGRYDAAVQHLAVLMPHAQGDADRALLHRLASRARRNQGLGLAAIAEAEAALAAARAGKLAWEEGFAQEALALARADVGQTGGARAAMAQARAVLQAAGLQGDSTEARRFARDDLEIALAAGDGATADLLAAALQADAKTRCDAGQTPTTLEAAQSCELQGQLALAQGRLGDAAARHDQAASGWRALLPQTHPWLARSAVLAQRARVLQAPDDAAAREALAGAAATYVALLPSDSLRRPPEPVQSMTASDLRRWQP